MTDREKLVEVMKMAHALCQTTEVWAGNRYEAVAEKRDRARNLRMEAAIDAAERAGFRWVGPDDGR